MISKTSIFLNENLLSQRHNRQRLKLLVRLNLVWLFSVPIVAAVEILLTKTVPMVTRVGQKSGVRRGGSRALPKLFERNSGSSGDVVELELPK
jgi:hypothetical protein